MTNNDNIFYYQEWWFEEFQEGWPVSHVSPFCTTFSFKFTIITTTVLPHTFLAVSFAPFSPEPNHGSFSKTCLEFAWFVPCFTRVQIIRNITHWVCKLCMSHIHIHSLHTHTAGILRNKFSAKCKFRIFHIVKINKMPFVMHLWDDHHIWDEVTDFIPAILLRFIHELNSQITLEVLHIMRYIN